MKDTFLLCLATFALAVPAAHAASFIVQPVAGDESSIELGRTATKAIDSAGLGSTPSTSTGDPVPTTWPTHANDAGSNASATMWRSAAGNAADQWIMFDLGDSYELDGMRVWNYNESGAFTVYSIQSVDVRFSTSLTGAFGSTDETDTGWGTATTMTFAQAPGTTSYTGETITFSSNVTAQYVLFDVNTGYRDPGDAVGLSEVRFTAVPEPSAALLGALGLLALLRRRR